MARHELLLPYLILPQWKLTNSFIKLKALWSDSPIIAKHFHWLIFRDSYCSLPSTPTKKTKPSKETKSTPQPSWSRRMIMTCMTALATINASSPFELKSDRLLRRDLRQFQHPQGGLNSHNLSQSKTKAHVHKALLTRLQSDSELFWSALLSSNTKISSAVLDSGASQRRTYI